MSFAAFVWYGAQSLAAEMIIKTFSTTTSLSPLSHHHHHCSVLPDLFVVMVMTYDEEDIGVVVGSNILHYLTIITGPWPELTLMSAHCTGARPSALKGGELTLAHHSGGPLQWYCTTTLALVSLLSAVTVDHWSKLFGKFSILLRPHAHNWPQTKFVLCNMICFIVIKL